jgi:citrate/tricarballylate utilization protein
MAVVAALLIALVALGGGRLLVPVPHGDFYALVPHSVMAGAFGAVGLFVFAALAIGFWRFWRDAGESLTVPVEPRPLGQALRDMLNLRNLQGSGTDCTFAGEEQRSPLRRWFHHLTFYGFLLCFAATCIATIYHYALGWPAPYAYTSLPVLLGTVGGIGLVVGPLGLFWLGIRRDPATGGPPQRGLDAAFVTLLVLTSLSGLLLLALRETAAMGVLLVVHLGVVMALFAMLPYGKFVHGLYHAAALIKYSLERSRPGPHLWSED